MDEKELVEEKIHVEIDKELNQYPVKLTWKQVYVGIIAALGIVGSIFGAGYKVNSEVNKVQLAKKDTVYQEQLTNLQKQKDSSDIKLNNAMQEVIYFQGRYEVVNKRLDACLKREVVYDSFIMSCPPKDREEIKGQIDKVRD